jgi:two-component system chemotaxis response regulator CheB
VLAQLEVHADSTVRILPRSSGALNGLLTNVPGSSRPCWITVSSMYPDMKMMRTAGSSATSAARSLIPSITGILVVGASAGGVTALESIVRRLPANLNAAVLVVIHTLAEGPYLLPEILSRAGPLRAERVADGDPIEKARIYVAPPDKHLLVGEGRVSLSRGPKENRSRPAIDPLFRTAAAAFGERVVGLILTGMLNDGTAGLLPVKERGGIAVVQDPEDALYSQMPQSAITHVAVDHVAPLAKLPSLLARLMT